MGSYEDPTNTSQTIVDEVIEGLLTGARLRAEKEVEEKRDSKRRRLSEKDRNKEDEDDEDDEDKEEIPESKKAKKSPVKTKPRKRGRPAGKDKDKEDKEDREDIPESRKVKRAPRKRINLKKKQGNQGKMYILSGGVPSGNPLGGCGQTATQYTTGLNLQELPRLSQRRRGNEGD